MEPEKDNILIEQGAKKASIHTANDDISKALSGSSARIVKDTIDFAREKESLKKEETLESSKNKILFGLTILFFASSAFFIILGFQKQEVDISVDPVVAYQGIVTYDNTINIGEFEPKRSLILEKIKKAKQENSKIGISRFRFSNIDPVSSDVLIESLEVNPGVRFKSTIKNFIDIGIYNDGQKNYTFMLISTDGTDQSFAGFSLWENNILFDLGEILEVNAQTAFDPIYQKKFEPITIESKDGRVLRDAEGNIILVMIFIDENHALITNEKQVVKKILDRVLLKK